MNLNSKTYSEGNSYALADYSVTFTDIEKMEEKRTNFNQEAKAMHEATVKEWDRLYESIIVMAEKYKDSAAFKDSQIGKRFFAPADTMAGQPLYARESVEQKQDG